MPLTRQIVAPKSLPFLVSILLLNTPSDLAAQHLGVTLARTSSDIITSYGNGSSTSYQNRSAFSVGLTYRRPIAPRVAVQPELHIVPKGYGTASSPTRELTYLEAPLLLRIGALAPQGAPVSPVLTLGPTISLLATCTMKGLDAISQSDSCNQVITKPFQADYRQRRLDAGLIAGFGLEGRLKSGSIVGVDARADFGLVDIQRSHGFSQNVSFYISAAYTPARWH